MGDNLLSPQPREARKGGVSRPSEPSQLFICSRSGYLRRLLAFAADRARMVNPPHSVAEYVNGIEAGGLKQVAAMLLELSERL